jgi:hypothetical protein
MAQQYFTSPASTRIRFPRTPVSRVLLENTVLYSVLELKDTASWTVFLLEDHLKTFALRCANAGHSGSERSAGFKKAMSQT